VLGGGQLVHRQVIERAGIDRVLDGASLRHQFWVGGKLPVVPGMLGHDAYPLREGLGAGQAGASSFTTP
jgi:hypothetical protein